MRPIIFCGYHRTGKTGFIERAIRALKDRGFRVACIKNISGHAGFRLEKGDTHRYLDAGADSTTAVTGDYTVKYAKEPENATPVRKRLHTLLMEQDADYILIEGFKRYDGPIPRIVFGNKRDEVLGLINELTVGYTGIHAADYHITGVPFIPPDIDDDSLASLIREAAIPFVADLDCGECGMEDCRTFVRAVLNKEISQDRCVPMHSEVELTINGKNIHMKEFVRSILRGVVEGFVSKLRDYKKGDIHISIRR